MTSMDSSGTDAVIEGRRNTDMAAAIAIAELRVEMRTLTATVKDSYALLTRSVENVQKDHATVTYGVRAEVKEAILDFKKEILEDLKEHTHTDLAPHQGTIGRRVSSLETSRTYTKGIIAVGGLVMPFVSAFIFKWIAG